MVSGGADIKDKYMMWTMGIVSAPGVAEEGMAGSFSGSFIYDAFYDGMGDVGFWQRGLARFIMDGICHLAGEEWFRFLGYTDY